MTVRSKAKRDANRKKQDRNEDGGGTVEGHAELRDPSGQLLGGIARKDGEWVLGLDGRMVGGSDSAATILSMLKRAAAMHERAGNRVTLKFSDALRAAAEEDARLQGMSLEAFQERLERELPRAEAPVSAPPSTH